MSAPQTNSELLAQLSRNSTPYQDPLSRIDWESLPGDQFWLPEEGMSLYGLAEYHALPRVTRLALSRYEFLHVIEAGLWLEGIFMTRISQTINHRGRDLPRLIYNLHELREEAGHSLMFVELIRRSGLSRPRTRFHRMRLANALGHYAPFDSSGFWIAVLIGEELPDRLNRFIRKYRDEICPAVYDMTKIHIIEEARHIAHAREVLEGRMKGMPAWRLALIRPVICRVFRQFTRALYFPEPDVYRLAGLSNPVRWAHRARSNPHRIRFVDEIMHSALRGLRDLGVDLRWR
ncbi:diiron oxygenase [Ectothiorhodospiraceae bacterium 2226]|nr:diiron oxygenase [Ectothiorhodospiraceae bacterium 2226]